MLALTKKVGYGLIAMTHLAKVPSEQLCSSREIAEEFGVPASLLMKILKELAAGGFVKSVRGAHGGYLLAKRPAEISVADVITVLEGPVRLAECISDEHGVQSDTTCSLMADCPIADPIHRVHRKIYDFMKQLTLAEIVELPPTAGDEGHGGSQHGS